MAEIIKEPWVEEWTGKHICFFRQGENDCYLLFHADENGNPQFMCEQAKINFENASKNDNVTRKDFDFHRSYRHGPLLRCDCGTEFELHNMYYGTCECPECERWYTLSGQRVKAPNEYDIDSEW